MAADDTRAVVSAILWIHDQPHHPHQVHNIGIRNEAGMAGVELEDIQRSQSQGLLWCTQVEGTLKAGAPIKARILDVSKKDGVVDLSLRPLHTAAGVKKAAKALESIEASPHSYSQPPSFVRQEIFHGLQNPSLNHL